ncbi:MAG: hypothetical protein ACNA8H_09035 [Anaerolineales bacterium]
MINDLQRMVWAAILNKFDGWFSHPLKKKSQERPLSLLPGY